MDAVESSAGQSATSRAVRQPTTGWRTRWWTAAQAARFASPSLSDATTAGTVGSSSARSAVASNQRSNGWRSRHRWEFVRTVTTTCNTSEALRTAAETELLRQKRNTSWGLEDLRSFSFLHLPCSTLYSSHISQNKNPLYPPVRPVTTCTVTHWQTVTRRENVVLFITTAVKFSEGGGKKWAWKKTGGGKKNNNKTQSPLLPPALITWLEENKSKSTPDAAACLNQITRHFCFWGQEQGKKNSSRHNKLVYIVNIYHGLFNSKRNKHRTKNKVNDWKKKKIENCL